MLLEIPATLLSGIGILTEPEQNVEEADVIFNFTGTTPKQIKAGLGVTAGAGGGTHCAIVCACINNVINKNKPLLKNCFFKVLLAVCKDW